jgi:hypothetical protein
MASKNDSDALARVRQLGLDDPEHYTGHPGGDWMRLPPAEVDERAADDFTRYHEYLAHSCDVTMRGGTTSGVIYPLAVCSLAEHYTFRSIGGASAGAIAASVTAAAEYGRFAEQPKSVPDGSVRPGFAGLAGLVGWMISGTGKGRWRMAQLFQPAPELAWVFRLLMAVLQSPKSTGRGRAGPLFIALLYAVGFAVRLLLGVVLLAWLAAPFALQWLLPPDRWNHLSWLVAGILAALAVLTAGWLLRVAAGKLGWGALLLAIPLVLGALGLVLWAVTDAHDAPLSSWFAAGAVVTLGWFLVSLAVLTIAVLIYVQRCWPVIGDMERVRYGLLPGAVAYKANWVDRRAGVPKSTGVPPLAIWLADRIDELAGFTANTGDERRALTFGDLWVGPDAEEPVEPDRMRELARNTGLRVINLALMSTDISGGRPYRVPFRVATREEERWQFCEECLDGIVPDRIVEQMKAAGSTATRCPRHPKVSLFWLPEPWDLPVVFGARMSLPLPGLICPVPLCREGKLHWFSDGGITSNFPIHFFDSLLPRWPTFGLNLESQEKPVADGQGVRLPKQDDTRPAEPWSNVGTGVLDFFGRILNTFLGWRDTMQCALPGFRGRIASVAQGPDEGGMNLFMPPETIATLALRGHQAGEELKQRFTRSFPGVEVNGFTQTDRYRWIRMRLALREYRELVRQTRARAPLYRTRTARYEVPDELSGWFADQTGPWPKPEPYTTLIEATFDDLTALSNAELADPFDGTAPVDPVLRLTPPE